jgi:hypothetical protein
MARFLHGPSSCFRTLRHHAFLFSIILLAKLHSMSYSDLLRAGVRGSSSPKLSGLAPSFANQNSPAGLPKKKKNKKKKKPKTQNPKPTDLPSRI